MPRAERPRAERQKIVPGTRLLVAIWGLRDLKTTPKFR
jgi:hypothetical protein